MTNRSRLFLLCFLLIAPAFSKGEVPPEDLQDRKLQLEVRKLEAEVRQIEEADKKSSAQTILSVVGGLGAFITLAWTVLAGIHSFRESTRNQKEARISKLSELLSNSSLPARLGAARGLARYANEAYPELLCACETEEASVVRHAVVHSLENGDENVLNAVLVVNEDSLRDRAYVMGGLGGPPENHAQKVLLSPPGARRLRRSFSAFYDKGNAGRRNPTTEADFLAALQTALRVRDVSAEVISSRFRNGYPGRGKTLTVDLSVMNLYGMGISSIRFTNSHFHHSICRHSTLDYVSFEHASLEHALFYDSTFSSLNLSGCYLDGASLRECVFTDAMFDDCQMNNVDLCESVLRRSNMENIQAEKPKWRGVNLLRTRLSKSVMREIQGQGATFTECLFEGTDLFRANLTEAKFTRVTMSGVRLNGSDLSSCVFIDCDLSGADFSGARLAGARFSGCILRADAFEKCHEAHIERTSDRAVGTLPPPRAGVRHPFTLRRLPRLPIIREALAFLR
jgi:uncharacterized protein YjbI with pentapeptide repeats